MFPVDISFSFVIVKQCLGMHFESINSGETLTHGTVASWYYPLALGHQQPQCLVAKTTWKLNSIHIYKVIIINNHYYHYCYCCYHYNCCCCCYYYYYYYHYYNYYYYYHHLYCSHFIWYTLYISHGVMTRKCFLHYKPFVDSPHKWLMGSPHKGPIT